MANKLCPICHKKISLMTARIKLKKENTTICKDCLINAGYDGSMKTITNVSNMLTVKEIADKILFFKSNNNEIDKKTLKSRSTLELEQKADPALLIKVSKNYVKSFKSTSEVMHYLKFNKDSGELLIRSTVLSSWRKSNIRNIKNYEVIQNGKNLQGFGVGRAAAGAVLTGGIGLLIGFTKKKEVVTELRLHLTLDSIDNPAFDFKLITSKTKTDSFSYKSSLKSLEELTNFFDVTISQFNVNHDVEKTTISVADELTKFKELLDSGVINQDEFEKQKSKLLN